MFEAQRADIIIEVLPQAGDFLTEDDPLFYLYGNAGAIDSRKLLTLIALGRTDDGAGSDVFISHRGRHRSESSVAGDQRSYTAVLAIDQLHVCCVWSASALCAPTK